MRNNPHDRALGDYWERRFMARAESHGWEASQIPQVNGNPDVYLLKADGERRQAHEVKHKKPMWSKYLKQAGYWGLERYRLDRLLGFQRRNRIKTFYTIHDWDEFGVASQVDRPEQWITQSIDVLVACPYQYDDEWSSYFGGAMSRAPMPAVAWHRFCFRSLQPVLEGDGVEDEDVSLPGP